MAFVLALLSLLFWVFALILLIAKVAFDPIWLVIIAGGLLSLAVLVMTAPASWNVRA